MFFNDLINQYQKVIVPVTYYNLFITLLVLLILLQPKYIKEEIKTHVQKNKKVEKKILELIKMDRQFLKIKMVITLINGTMINKLYIKNI